MRTVLIVDDSNFITEGLASILKRNYRTIIASGGEMCLQILKKETPDIIILDILMEPMDGWETLLRIRENPATRHVPIIMFSAKKISPFEAETHHPYIDDYITKPVSPRNLLDTIARILSRREMSQKTLQLWRQAGLAAEEIEEYIRLVTSIEVERGLCANMEQQILTGRRDSTVEDIRRSVLAIGERIDRDSRLAEDIASRGEALVAERGGPDALSLEEDITSHDISVVMPEGVLSPGSLESAAVLTTAAAVGDTETSPPVSNRDSQGLIAESVEGSGAGIPIPTHEAETVCAEIGGEYTSVPTAQDLPVSLAMNTLDPEDLPATLETDHSTQYPISADPEREIPYSPAVIESLLEDEPEQGETPSGESIHTAEKNTDILQPLPAIVKEIADTPKKTDTFNTVQKQGLEPSASSDIQSSTKTPGIRKDSLLSGKTGSMKIPVQPKKNTGLEKPTPAPGFFARIIQAILGLFSGSKR